MSQLLEIQLRLRTFDSDQEWSIVNFLKNATLKDALKLGIGLSSSNLRLRKIRDETNSLSGDFFQIGALFGLQPRSADLLDGTSDQDVPFSDQIVGRLVKMGWQYPANPLLEKMIARTPKEPSLPLRKSHDMFKQRWTTFITTWVYVLLLLVLICTGIVVVEGTETLHHWYVEVEVYIDRFWWTVSSWYRSSLLRYLT